MANYTNVNIVPAWNEDAWSVISGGATVTSEYVYLPIDSSVRLQLIKSNALMGSSYMKVIVKFTGTFSELDEYNLKCDITAKITYLDNTIQYCIIAMNKYQLESGKYVDITELATNSKNINSIEIYFRNKQTALGPLYIHLFEIYKSEDVNSGQIAEAISETVQLKSLTSYDNGCIIEWKGDIESLKIEFITGVSNEFLGLLVDDTDFIQYTKISGTLPES